MRRQMMYLTFVEPDWWRALAGEPFPTLEGAFWSLYVEWKFYLFAALFYYWKGPRAMIVALLLAALSASIPASRVRRLTIVEALSGR